MTATLLHLGVVLWLFAMAVYCPRSSGNRGVSMTSRRLERSAYFSDFSIP
jgi:hypothetical protein